MLQIPQVNFSPTTEVTQRFAEVSVVESSPFGGARARLDFSSPSVDSATKPRPNLTPALQQINPNIPLDRSGNKRTPIPEVGKLVRRSSLPEALFPVASCAPVNQKAQTVPPGVFHKNVDEDSDGEKDENEDENGNNLVRRSTSEQSASERVSISERSTGSERDSAVFPLNDRASADQSEFVLQRTVSLSLLSNSPKGEGSSRDRDASPEGPPNNMRTKRVKSYFQASPMKEDPALRSNPIGVDDFRINTLLARRDLEKFNMVKTRDSPLDPQLGSPGGEGGSPLLLPYIPHSHPRRVSCDTVARLIKGEFAETVRNYLIIDARYTYEYHGGHIKGAYNFNLKHHIKDFHKANKDLDFSEFVIIFHCEYSKNRGPNCCRYFRKLDRGSNTYPQLTFPQVFVMDGGFNKFFEQYSSLCSPEKYVTMWDKQFADDCKMETARYRTSWSTTGYESRVRGAPRLIIGASPSDAPDPKSTPARACGQKRPFDFHVRFADDAQANNPSGSPQQEQDGRDRDRDRDIDEDRPHAVARRTRSDGFALAAYAMTAGFSQMHQSQSSVNLGINISTCSSSSSGSGSSNNNNGLARSSTSPAELIGEANRRAVEEQDKQELGAISNIPLRTGSSSSNHNLPR